ncbi:hypothetical protein V1478_003414 [Vespula squamosa]|uniref:Uncharacterized protein n=1 Tax=Vespula squamosa TaxID=30214 RepID=A0ABD2BLT4_VESSQ
MDGRKNVKKEERKRADVSKMVGPRLESYFSLLPLLPSTDDDDDDGGGGDDDGDDDYDYDDDDDDDDDEEEVDENENEDEDEDEDDDDNDAVESRGIKASVGWQMPTALESTVITDVGN